MNKLILMFGFQVIPNSILELSGARKKIKMALCNIFQHYDSFVERGSGWVLKKVLQVFQNQCTKAGHQYSIPEKDCAFFKFSNYKNMVPVPFIMYCDLEDNDNQSD